jgi:hypothetical protein
MYVDESEWTTDRLKNEFFLCLAKAPDNKYYEDAKALMYKIPLTPQYPHSELEAIPLIINFADLSSRVQSEFKQYCIINNKKKVGLFLKEIAIRLFENLDYGYAHMSVMRKLRIKVVKSQ